MSGRRPVLAAVDDSPAAVAVVGQAAALAVRENRQLLVLTVRPASAGYPAVEAGPGGAGLLRMNGVDSAGGAGDSPLAGNPSARAARLLVAGYRDRGGRRRQVRRISTLILAGAQAHRAARIVIGLPDRPRPRAHSVSSRVAYGAPAGVRVVFAAPAAGRWAAATGGEPAVSLAALSELSELSDPVMPAPPAPHWATMLLTPAGRGELTRQYLRLRCHVLPRVRDLLGASATLSPAQRQQLAAVYQAAIERRRHLTDLLAHAGRTERLPADPTTVEVGDLVRVDGDAAAITLLVVDPVEATYVEQAWLLADRAPGSGRRVDVLPADTGLGFALLGRRVGDRVSVPPGGPGRRPRTLQVLHCRRLRPSDLTAAPRRRQPDHEKGHHRARPGEPVHGACDDCGAG